MRRPAHPLTPRHTTMTPHSESCSMFTALKNTLAGTALLAGLLVAGHSLAAPAANDTATPITTAATTASAAVVPATSATSHPA